MGVIIGAAFQAGCKAYRMKHLHAVAQHFNRPPDFFSYNQRLRETCELSAGCNFGSP
jgi:hypothetical protein